MAASFVENILEKQYTTITERHHVNIYMYLLATKFEDCIIIINTSSKVRAINN